MKKVVWGVLSTARIGVQKVIPGLMKSDLIEVRGIASRHLDSAQTAAKALGIPNAYGSYEDLLGDPDIEAIYNPLPNHLHVPMTLAAAKAGKHVLCEKPMSITASEIDALAEVADKVLISEAFMVRHATSWQEALHIVRSGTLGEVKLVQVNFNYFNRDPDNIRNKPEMGGGGLLDIGGYAVVAGRYFFEAEPVRVISMIERDPEFGTDTLSSALIDFGQGRQLNFSVSTSLTRGQFVLIAGTKARLTIPVAFNPIADTPSDLWIDDGEDLTLMNRKIITLPASDQYQRLGEDFSKAIRGLIPQPYGIADAKQNMRILDALFASEKTAGWVTLA
jgi:predicted dehydrogenase